MVMDFELKTGNGSPRVEGAGRELSEAALFAIVWDALADMLGTAAVAAVVRRAAQRASTERPELAGLVVVRQNLDYEYTLPRSWEHNTEHEPAALRVLVRELGRLLMELTGTVVLRRLEEIPELRARGIVGREVTK